MGETYGRFLTREPATTAKGPGVGRQVAVFRCRTLARLYPIKDVSGLGAARYRQGVTLVRELDAFFQEHRRCGDLDGDGEGDRIWMTCMCDARLQTARREPSR